ncbi:hypothetical protein C5C18_00445 [Rathayibacter tritici]|uniref:hypothetical protein n=1 Tax=Rathayibacter tritici TaxID=33888 RepID=UPI0008366831|nr:hypothetical protein [Rathayibacter tritici]PPF28832.1 hypothetical protein C5C06_07535 [Rathayibacter tritici]PPF67918.1 hypothetical protein C5C21_06125 [Rathayibacter tritici]PPG09490.1 hypothetical protein C5C18_00445 [Rathayibacter tritici]PPI13365.1 hypothetical protein C5D07_09870 [Rathayibacter tritici]PPI43221.1 hypothetical protein C5D18_10080 [Rathayibacter tritici]
MKNREKKDVSERQELNYLFSTVAGLQHLSNDTAPPFPVPTTEVGPEPAPVRPRSALALTALILGIVAIILSIIPLIWGLAIPVGVGAVIVGAIALIKRGHPKWLSITGLALGSIQESPASDPSFAPDAPEPAPVADLNSAFGAAVTYTDGVAISVSAPGEYIPGE